MTGDYWHIRNKHNLGKLIEHLQATEIGEYGYLVKLETGKRTSKQNSAMHVYFRELADALNDAGLEIHMQFLGKSIDVPWTAADIKQRIWQPVQFAATGSKSTTMLDRVQVGQVYEIINRHMAQTHGIVVMFPDRFS